MVTFVNLTPHALIVKCEEYTHDDETYDEVYIEASGTVARVEMVKDAQPDIHTDYGTSFKLDKLRTGNVTGLHVPMENTLFIVSAMVAQACPDRDDLICPDTGPTAIRNHKGHITAVRGFVKY